MPILHPQALNKFSDCFILHYTTHCVVPTMQKYNITTVIVQVLQGSGVHELTNLPRPHKLSQACK